MWMRRALINSRLTCCASAAAEALRKLSKCTRSRAPKAVSCKRLLDGEPPEVLRLRRVLLQRHRLWIGSQPTHQFTRRILWRFAGGVNQPIRDCYIIHRVMTTCKTAEITTLSFSFFKCGERSLHFDQISLVESKRT